MKHRPRRFLMGVGGCLILGITVTALFLVAGYRLNLSPSFPVGIWQMTRPFIQSIDKGKTVIVETPRKAEFRLAKSRNYLRFGFSNSGIQPLMKQVVGLAGDSIEVSHAGVSINGISLPNSLPLQRDSKGRELFLAGSRILKAGEVWVMSTYSPNSFDSRYFGPIPLTSIQGVVEPVWVWHIR